MRKAIGVLVMVVAVGGFVFMTMRDNKGSETDASTNEVVVYNDAASAIKDINQEIEEEYPTTANSVVELHNKLMGICYKYSMDDKDIKSYVEAVRKLYAKELTELNTEESQIAQLKEELGNMQTDEMELVTSKITEVYIAKNDKGQEVSAEINVTHATNLGSTNRTYYLNKENGLWKINSWETIASK